MTSNTKSTSTHPNPSFHQPRSDRSIQSHMTSNNTFPTVPANISTASQDLKYSYIRDNLEGFSQQYIISLLLNQLQDNDSLNNQLFILKNKLAVYEQDQKHLQDSLTIKRSKLDELSRANTRNLQAIDMLEAQLNSLRNRYELGQEHRQTTEEQWELKYKELNRYMAEYIRHTTEVQEQFRRNHAILKSENARLAAHSECLMNNLNQERVNATIMRGEITKGSEYISQLKSNIDLAQAALTQTQNQNKYLQSQLFQLQSSQQILYQQLHTERTELQKELAFVKERFNENTGLSQQIIKRYQQLESKYVALEREKQNFLNFSKAHQRKIQELEACIKAENQMTKQKEVKLQELHSKLEKTQSQLAKSRFQCHQLTEKLRSLEHERSKAARSQLILKEVEKFVKKDKNILKMSVMMSQQKSQETSRSRLSKGTIQTDKENQQMHSAEAENDSSEPLQNITSNTYNMLMPSKSHKTFTTSSSKDHAHGRRFYESQGGGAAIFSQHDSIA